MGVEPEALVDWAPRLSKVSPRGVELGKLTPPRTAMEHKGRLECR